MIPAPIPAGDERRVAALRALLVLDTPPEERFDRIVAFAAAEFGVPFALVSLTDRSRQWFKARHGVEVCEASRETSFCGHAILGPGVFVVPDTLLDPKFAGNPNVTGGLGVRFYAGAPLVIDSGETVGTLCVMDRAPRAFDNLDRSILSALAQVVVEELQGVALER